LTEQESGHGQHGDPGRAASPPEQPAPAPPPGYSAPPGQQQVPPGQQQARQARQLQGTKGFFGALFDFGFTSFVTPKIIKVLYPLIMIGAILSALSFVAFAFRAGTGFGILTLFVLAPLFFLVVMAIYRIVLEFFIVIFRISDDIRALRERGDFR
jgi:uncharacterized membrane protein